MITPLLKPFELLYGAATRARAEFYRRGIFKSYDLPGFVVSVGNITVGGTGKTPLVALVARVLAEKGERVCILTRGYGRANPKKRVVVSDGEAVRANARESGDEPFELALKLKGISAVIADADRVSAASWTRANLKSTAFVLDDGFQHRRARRDLDIVCVDATKPFGNGKLLPVGALREPLKSLKRADVFLVTRADLVAEDEIGEIKQIVRKYNDRAPVFISQNRLSRLTDLKGIFQAEQRRTQYKTEETQDQSPINNYQSPSVNRPLSIAKFLAFCALGNPENFFAQLRKENFNLVAAKAFRDHYFYAQKDIDDLKNEANLKGATGFLTTAKDAVKLADLKFDLPCYVVENEMIIDECEAFERLITTRLYESKEFSKTVSEMIS